MLAEPTTEELDALFEQLKNWDRWGDGDERGALNHQTDDHRRAAAALVDRRHRSAWPTTSATEPSPETPYPAHHHMLAAGDARDGTGHPGLRGLR